LFSQVIHAPDAARRAIGLLEWSGLLLPRMSILGRVVYPVVTVDRLAHQRRADRGQSPMLDLDVLETWEWPEAPDTRAPEVVTVRGVISDSKPWHRALADVTSLSGFCPGAIITETTAERCELECSYYETGLIRADRLVTPARSGRCVGARRRTLDRWVEESLYRHLIEDGLID